MFLWRNKKNINTFLLKKASYLSYEIYCNPFCITSFLATTEYFLKEMNLESNAQFLLEKQFDFLYLIKAVLSGSPVFAHACLSEYLAYSILIFSFPTLIVTWYH